MPSTFIIQKVDKVNRGAAILGLNMSNKEQRVEDMRVEENLGDSDG